MVGKKYYKYHKTDRLLSEFTTVSDEALAILIYENNIETWKDMASKNITKNSMVGRKYTNGGSSNGEIASSRRYQGWSNCGIKRFNKLFDLVKRDRESPHAKQFELCFQDFCVDGGVSGKPKKTQKRLTESIKVRHDLPFEPQQTFPSNSNDNETDLVLSNQCVDEEILNQKMNGDYAEDSDDDEDPNLFGHSANLTSV